MRSSFSLFDVKPETPVERIARVTMGNGRLADINASAEPLFERYRPRQWEDIVGQDGAVKQLLALKGFAGRAFWISGSSGTGKTTIAKLLANAVADSFNVDEIDATCLTVASLGEIEKVSHCYGFGKGGRAYIINEAHGLRRDVVRQLLVILERIPRHVCYVFTTTTEGQDQLFKGVEDTSPLLSRCVYIPLEDDPRQAFAKRAKDIAERENLGGHPLDRYLALADSCRCNLRMMLQAVETRQLDVQQDRTARADYERRKAAKKAKGEPEPVDAAVEETPEPEVGPIDEL